MAASPGMLLVWWRRLSGLPGGKSLFSRLFGLAIPYSGSVRPLFRELAPGRAVISIRDRRALANHLSSIHAIALTNVAEMSTGAAVASGLPDGMRAILVRVECTFLKKARGTITATCEAPVFREIAEKEVPVDSVLTNEAGEVVARGKAVWLAGPVK